MRALINIAAAVLLTGMTGSPLLAKDKNTAKTHVAQPPETIAKAPLPVIVVTTQHPAWGRVTFVLRGNPEPEIRHLPGAMEVRFPAGTHLQVSPTAHLRETGVIETRDEDGTTVVLVRLACHCDPEEQDDGGLLRLDLHKTTATAGVDAAGAKSPAIDAAAPVAAEKAAAAVQGAAPERATERAEAAGKAKGAASERATERAEAADKAKEKATEKAAAKEAGPKAKEASEMGQLRESLAAKLAMLNGAPADKPHGSVAAPPPVAPVPPPQAASDAAAEAPPEPVAAPPPAPPPVCLAPVDASAWRGPDEFTPRLIALRARLAASKASAGDMIALTEFYLANGLGHEAVFVATDALEADATPEERLRLLRDADIARLLKGDQISSDSPLLAVPPGCDRPDAKLWRALAAAASRDAEGAARNAEDVAALLRTMPEPMQRGLAFRIVGAVGDNQDALRAMAGALRNTTIELPEDEARRFLLQARIANLAGDQSDYVAFLERAARDDRTVPGIIAKARLAALRAAEGGPAAAHDEMVLADIARTYRHEALGQRAAEQYAELQLRRHDYAAALEIADESAGPRGDLTRESRGASLAVRILRMLFVDPGTAALPPPAERIALFLRYGGYTTPGDKGDDIRLAAAKLMLAERMPYPALDTVRQLSGASASTPDGQMMRATAEAYAGDPAKAMNLIQSLPDDIAGHRIAAEALHRMDKPLAAAHALDNATVVADRARRASLFFEAEAWKDAASAYADLLADPALPGAMRDDLAERYALAVAMTGEAATAVPPKLPEGPAGLQAAGPVPPAESVGAAPSLSIVRAALERARHIENLLAPIPDHQGS